MPFNAFEKALEFVFKWEGIDSNNKDDPGGITRYGVTIPALKEAGLDLTKDGVIDSKDIAKLDIQTAAQIYKNTYWNGIGGGDIPWPLAIAAFDTAVNVGPNRSKRWLDDTVSKGEDYKYFLNLRIIHYMSIIQKNPKLAKFKKGWLNRVNDLDKMITILKDNESEQT